MRFLYSFSCKENNYSYCFWFICFKNRTIDIRFTKYSYDIRFCASIKAHADWAMDFCDKLMMFEHEDDLLQRLWSHIEEYLRNEAKQYMKQADEYTERANRFKQSCG
ncbi:unnamed protein product [Rotaria magnacalcarata]|uniref:Uncharacterized protein n=1 Tax=Rotaria magnacalcarata TaxID=392030 RepID=A0A818YQV5_9BILA|nr:unnamed protein product [Rotaria magnacalcarata]CAF3758924.1 unnamed protein product [Rotaria magnacalcarata]